MSSPSLTRTGLVLPMSLKLQFDHFKLYNYVVGKDQTYLNWNMEF